MWAWEAESFLGLELLPSWCQGAERHLEGLVCNYLSAVCDLIKDSGRNFPYIVLLHVNIAFLSGQLGYIGLAVRWGNSTSQTLDIPKCCVNK